MASEAAQRAAERQIAALNSAAAAAAAAAVATAASISLIEERENQSQSMDNRASANTFSVTTTPFPDSAALALTMDFISLKETPGLSNVHSNSNAMRERDSVYDNKVNTESSIIEVHEIIQHSTFKKFQPLYSLPPLSS